MRFKRVQEDWQSFSRVLKSVAVRTESQSGATIFDYYVRDPREYEGRGFTWLDTDNHDMLLAADFVSAFQKRQGL